MLSSTARTTPRPIASSVSACGSAPPTSGPRVGTSSSTRSGIARWIGSAAPKASRDRLGNHTSVAVRTGKHRLKRHREADVVLDSIAEIERLIRDQHHVYSGNYI